MTLPAEKHPRLCVINAAAWRQWLDVHEAASDGVWLTLAKKGVLTPTSLSYEQALDEALCSGWIDGQVQGLDAHCYLQRFTPRRARSLWSARNVEHIARLVTARRLRPRGEGEVARAQADGRWAAAYAGPAGSAPCPEFAAALAASPTAAAAFAAQSGQNRYAMLHRLATVKRAETRSRNIAKYIAMLERGETLHN